MARDLRSRNLGMVTLLGMDILATGVMEDTEAMHMEPPTDLMEGVDTGTIKRAALHGTLNLHIVTTLHCLLFTLEAL